MTNVICFGKPRASFKQTIEIEESPQDRSCHSIRGGLLRAATRFHLVGMHATCGHNLFDSQDGPLVLVDSESVQTDPFFVDSQFVHSLR